MLRVDAEYYRSINGAPGPDQIGATFPLPRNSGADSPLAGVEPATFALGRRRSIH